MSSKAVHRANRQIYAANENGVFIATDANIHDAVARYLRKNVDLLPPISEWDTSQVTNMSNLFYEKRQFNSDISNWDVSNVTNMSWMFKDCEIFNQPLDKWNVSNVTDMNGMFFGCIYFDQPLNNWDVSNVTHMGAMFMRCARFNKPLNNWNVRNVESMESMFEYTLRFNQDLKNWVLADNVDIRFMFRDARVMSEGFKPKKKTKAQREKEQYNRIKENEAIPLAYDVLPVDKSETKDTTRIPPNVSSHILEYVGMTQRDANKIAKEGDLDYLKRTGQYQSLMAQKKAEDRLFRQSQKKQKTEKGGRRTSKKTNHKRRKGSNLTRRRK
jgi:surface protein